MDELGDWLMILGIILMSIGGVGLTLIGIVMAFGMSMSAGFLAILVSGMLWGTIGNMIGDM